MSRKATRSSYWGFFYPPRAVRQARILAWCRVGSLASKFLASEPLSKFGSALVLAWHGSRPIAQNEITRFFIEKKLPPCTHTHILALLFQRKNKGRLPASGKDASHPESHVDADSVRSVSTLGWGEHFNSFSYMATQILPAVPAHSATCTGTSGVFPLHLSAKSAKSAP